MVIDWLYVLQLVLVILSVLFLLFILISQVILRIVRKCIYQFPIPAFATRLIDNPIRRKLVQPPGRVADRMHLEPGMTVVEIGPGKGNYTKAVAERILERLKEKVKREGIPNIVPAVGDAYNLKFDDGSVDRIFAITCLPEIPEPVRVLREFKRILKPDGIISLSELAPDPDYPRRKTEKRWADEAGLEFREGFGNFFVYQLNFKKETLKELFE